VLGIKSKMIKNIFHFIKIEGISKDNFVRARIKLALRYSLVTMFIVAILEILFFIVYSQNLYQNFDNSIRNRAYSIASILSTNEDFPANISILNSETGNNPFYGSDEIIQVMDSKGKVIFSTVDINKLNNSKLTINKFATMERIENIDNKKRKIPLQTYTTLIKSDKSVLGYVRVGQTYANLREILSESFVSLLLILPVIMILTWIIAYKTSKTILQPVEDSYKKLKQFTEDASHELKTPISIIRTNIDVVLEKEQPTNIELIRKMNVISRSINRMSKTIAQLLLIARVDSEGIKISKTSINLNNFISNIIEDFKILSDKKNINLNISTNEKFTIQVDPYLMEHILSNLIDNAIRYTPENGNVTIDIKQTADNKFIVISISDTGPGIGKEDLPYIFDRFYRTDKSRSRKTGGVGLGLAVVKEFTSLLNGKIEVKSEIGKGTTFYMYLPKNRQI
jgi:OmpR-family two-component system manganese-sensing sensor histidine kinase